MSLLLLFKLVRRLCCSLFDADGSGCSITIAGNCCCKLTKARSSSGLKKVKLNLRILIKTKKHNIL